MRHKGRFIKKKELTKRENVRKANIERSKQNRDKIVYKNFFLLTVNLTELGRNRYTRTVGRFSVKEAIIKISAF